MFSVAPHPYRAGWCVMRDGQVHTHVEAGRTHFHIYSDFDVAKTAADHLNERAAHAENRAAVPRDVPGAVE